MVYQLSQGFWKTLHLVPLSSYGLGALLHLVERWLGSEFIQLPALPADSHILTLDIESFVYAGANGWPLLFIRVTTE